VGWNWRRLMGVGVAVVGMQAALGAGLAATPAGGSASAAQAYVPAQFIAKQYTEGLGRMPDQPGWQSAVSYFTQKSCTAGSLAGFGEALLTSPEYTGLGYGNDAKILTLFRAALNREPDQAGFTNWTHQLASGLPWTTVVQKFFTSSEFTALVPKICSGVVDGSGSSYYFGTQAALALPPGGTASDFTGTELSLQALLNTTAKRGGGGTVKLAPRALVLLTKPLIVPSGVTLTTDGNPDPRHYADMGRLVRDPSFGAPSSLTGMVQVQKEATLSNVWVDGARDTPGNVAPLEDVITYGGPGTTLSNDKIGNAQGPNTVYLFGGYNGYTCPKETVSGNLITAYSSDHYLNATGSGDWTDGIADNCEGATISGNQVVDATDVAIVVYRNTTASAQQSVVTGNTVLSAGNSMYGGLGFDPLYRPKTQAAQTFSFAGGSIDHNTLWSGPDTHFDIGITDGSRAWFAGTYTADFGTGAAVSGNTTGTQTARVQIGVGVNGMLHTTVSANTMNFTHISGGRCPHVDYAAEIAAGYASGTFSPQPYDVNFDGCV
jgi:hypothetical protein